MAHQWILTSTLPCEELAMTHFAKLCSHSEGFCILAIKKSLSNFNYRPVQLEGSHMANQWIFLRKLPCEKFKMTDFAKLCSHSKGFCIRAIEKLWSNFSYQPVQSWGSQMANQWIFSTKISCEKLEMTNSAKLSSHSAGFCIFAIKKWWSNFSYSPVQSWGSQMAN